MKIIMSGKILTQLVGENEVKRHLQLFYLEKLCLSSVITMPQERLSEAFQLFDSQNNRWKKSFKNPHEFAQGLNHLSQVKIPKMKDVEKWSNC